MHDCDFPAMENIEISERGVATLLQNLNPHEACGPDGIRPHVLKELAREIAPALTALFKSFLSSGSVPADWRDAHITPIYKKGEQYHPANYRPVSLTSVRASSFRTCGHMPSGPQALCGFRFCSSVVTPRSEISMSSMVGKSQSCMPVFCMNSSSVYLLPSPKTD